MLIFKVDRWLIFKKLGFMPIILFWILLLFQNCNRELEISQKAYTKESKGLKSEALFEYSRALQLNSEYGFAHKRIGFILSESPESIGISIFHMEKARNEMPNDIELILRLFDAYSLTMQHDKFFKLLKESQLLLDETTYSNLENLHSCITKKEDAKNLMKKFSSLNELKLGQYYYRSMSSCLEILELSSKAYEITNKYKGLKL